MKGLIDHVLEEPIEEEPEDVPNAHMIQNKYTFWYRYDNSKGSTNLSNYKDSIKKIASFQSVERFWTVYDFLKRPGDFKDIKAVEYHLFKDGISPFWEDPINKQGGKWMLRLRKGIASRYWEDILIAIVGEQFDVGSEVCGAVLSIRTNEDIISVWNKSADNIEAINKIRDQIRRVVRLPDIIPIEYKRHQDSLTDKSSYRNPNMVWRAQPRNNNHHNNNNNNHGGGDHRGGGGGGEGGEGRRYNNNNNNYRNNNNNHNNGSNNANNYQQGGGGGGDNDQAQPRNYQRRDPNNSGGGGDGGGGRGWKSRWQSSDTNNGNSTQEGGGGNVGEYVSHNNGISRPVRRERSDGDQPAGTGGQGYGSHRNNNNDYSNRYQNNGGNNGNNPSGHPNPPSGWRRGRSDESTTQTASAPVVAPERVDRGGNITTEDGWTKVRMPFNNNKNTTTST